MCWHCCWRPKSILLPKKDDFKHCIRPHFGPENRRGISAFLGACYPECHPESANKIEEIRHLKGKGKCRSTSVAFPSYFFGQHKVFTVLWYTAGLRDMTCQIVPGIMPVINAAQIFFLLRCAELLLPERFQKIIHRFEDNKPCLFDAGMSYALSQYH